MSAEKKTRRSTKVPPMPAKSPGNSSSDELVIDIPGTMPSPNKPTKQQQPVTRSVTFGTPKATPEKRMPSTKKKRRRPPSCSSSSTTDDMEDQTFEETIERCATKNKLTPECVKKLLKKLVMNEHVLAIVKLKEEEEEQRDKNRQNASIDGTDGDDEDDDPGSLQPKLTRLKAKQLNKQPLPIVPLKALMPDEEVAALIREELGSDDDDEEYKPTEDEVHSDDDPNTTISDLDSQPRTPATPATPGGGETDMDQGALYTKDGLFKIPRPRNDSHSQSEQEQENIALRTRSKLCLQTTAIETIESTFIPPDITTDMYDFDCDMDHVWKEFLNEFTKPLSNHAEDDEDTDPEYVAADQVPIDREELLPVKVSKRELNELVSELLEMSGIVDESFLDQNFLNDVVPDNTVPQKNDQQAQKHQRPEEDAELNTPDPKKTKPSHDQPPSPVETTDNTVFQPTSVSTPTAPIVTNKVAPAVSTPTTPVITNKVAPTPAPLLTTQPMVLLNQIPAAQELSFANSSSSSCSVGNSLTTQSDAPTGQFFVQVSTPHESSFHKYYLPSTTTPVIPVAERPLVQPSERKYRYLHNLLPVSIYFPEGMTGFTDFQLQLFRQQLRIHVQIAAQNFLQSYAHPKFWNLADTFKKMLLDLQEAARTNSAAKAWNLDAAVECCLSWEADLQQETPENNDMIQFLLEEADKAEKAKSESKYYQGTFHPKMMDKVINNNAFLYPKLLPYTPYRMDLRSKKRFSVAEERLTAFGLEIFYSIATDELNKFQSSRGNYPTLQQVCRYISKYLCTIHTASQLYVYICSRRQRGQLNPIKYYFNNSKAPPYQHVLETIDFKNVLPPASYQQGTLPYLWDKYVYSKTRLAKISGFPVEHNIRAKSQEVSSSKEQSTATSDSNINITISVVLDPKQVSSSKSAFVINDIVYGNPQLVDQTCSIKKNCADKQDTHANNFLLVEEDSLPTVYRNSDSSTGEITEPGYTSYITEYKQESPISINDDSFDKNLPDECSSCIYQEQQNNASHCSGCRCHENDETEIASLSANVKRGQTRLTDYFHLTPKRTATIDRRTLLKEKLWEIYRKYRDLCRNSNKLNPHILQKVYKHFKLIERFSYFLDDLRSMSTNQCVKKANGEFPRNDPIMTNGTGRKLVKLDLVENKDANYAFNFFEKVEETLLAENKHAQYEQFLEILQTFNEKEDRVADLYYKIEDLLIADHPELVDLFLTFLLPGQAAEVGKFFEHFILNNANDFLTKLNIFFAKQPSQIRKIYTCLNDLSNEQDVTMEQIKARILPLLKGNPLLIEWFLQLFPAEKPPDGNLSDYETISMKKLPLPDCSDPNQIYEDVPFVEVPSESTGENTVCGTKYIQGRIVYGALPARLSFLAHDCAPPQKDSSPLKGCVHNVRVAEKAKSSGEGEDKEQDVISEDNQGDSRYKLCDDATFAAHAIRLNPLLHGGKGVNYADVAHLLIPKVDPPSEGVSTSDDEKTTSPKKCQIKTIPKKRINSPISKKIMGKNSPTASKKATFTVPPDSKVISISKKLKTMIESSPESCPESTAQCSTSSSAIKRKPTPVVPSAAVPIVIKKDKLQLRKSPSDEQSSDDRDEPMDTKEGTAQSSWTRDEDKVILEEIKNGYSTVEELVERIAGKIETRDSSEIERRYEFLMEVLKKFQKAN